MEKILKSFRRMGFVVRVRRFGEMKFIAKYLSEIPKAVCKLMIKGILELTFDISAVTCQLDSSDSVSKATL